MDCQTLSPLRVLMIADSASDVALVRQSLLAASPQAFVLEGVCGLQEGLVRLGTESFDAALIDLVLDDTASGDVLAVLAGFADELPMVVLLSASDSRVAQQALRHGAQDCVVKTRDELAGLARTLQHAVFRHQLTSPLRTAEAQLRHLSEQLPALLWTTDLQLRFTSCRGGRSPALESVSTAMVGRAVEELSQTAADAAVNRRLHDSALAGEARSAEFRWAGRWYQAHVLPLRSARGKVIGTIGIALDVTHERRLMKDIEMAHRVQQHLLPSADPNLAGFDIAGTCHPASDCSGDFYDYIPLPKRRLAIVLADVSGHGFGPAIMGAAIRSYLRTAAVLGHHVHEMLAIANRLLFCDADEGPFASVFAVRLDANSGSLQFTSAGHCALLMRRQGAVQVLETTCVPIGVREDECFPVSRPIRLWGDDLLLLASDGVFDTRRDGKDEMFGTARVVETVHDLWDKPAKEIVEGLYRVTREFAGGTPPDDDVTIVVVKRVIPDDETDTDAGQ